MSKLGKQENFTLIIYCHGTVNFNTPIFALRVSVFLLDS